MTKNDKLEIITATYRGPDRRKLKIHNGESKPKARVWFDERGRAILGFTDDTPRHRADDDTLDYLKALDPGSLSLEDDD